MGMSVNVVALLLVLAAMSSSSSLLFADAAFRARVFKVGGEDGWVVSPSEPLNHWSERQRFRKFDRLYFRYKAGEDSVLLVSKAAYQICNRTNPVNSFTDGKTLIELPHSGPLYFISGQPGHCEKGQKLIVRVLADRTPAPSSHSPAISPSQPPSAPSRAPTPHHPGKAPTAPPPSSPLSAPAAAPAVPASPAAPSPQAGAPAPAPNASGASLSASFGVAGLAAMVIGWMVMA